MNRDGGLEADLDVIRELLRKYGLQQVENMVHIADRSRKYPIPNSAVDTSQEASGF